ncbi:response regulator [Sphingomonas crocodyli]|uniref:Response regulator n=1 Tax=Sphingomonas crocodyli TaxID=1979270 RepID=A0A437M9W8_9SPHN|nr:response regulator [Sphingomonas crocodyli]RVT94404.1 response regulator [Sphingomonas crocodyli]
MKILCVEDDPLVREVTVDLLAALGHDVFPASGGEEALMRLRERGAAYDLLVTDIHMPGDLGGLSLVAMARANMPDLRVIYFSGTDQIPEDEKSILLRKPCSLGMFEEAIDRIAAR